MRNVLVTGGAGYIGSVTVNELITAGYRVFVVDNLSRGKRDLVHQSAQLFVGDVLDTSFLEKVFTTNKFDAVLHFASLKNAGESMIFPDIYSANIMACINVLNVMCKYGVGKIVFSSSAAVYGEPVSKVIDETHPTNPINFYGFTKLESERIIEWYSRLKGIKYVSLRYFNVAGDGALGYIDPQPGNIFPLLAETVFKKREQIQLFGSDYDTPDGTCIRDYVDVTDIADAHVRALNLDSNHFINLGTSKGHSVLELIRLFEKISGKKIPIETVARRAGDPDVLVASYHKAKELLQWQPERSIEEMVESTLAAYENNICVPM